MDDNNKYNDNNGAKIIIENGNMVEQSPNNPDSPKLSNKICDSIILTEFQSTDDSVKTKMKQYTQNFNTYNNNLNELKKDESIKTMKLNKEEEKDQEIPWKEINQNDINIFNKENFKKEIELITDLKKDFYRKCYQTDIYCDYKLNEKEEWKVGHISSIDENNVIVRNTRSNSKVTIKIDDFTKIAYLRKFSKPSNEIFYTHRDKLKNLKYKLDSINTFITDNHFINDKKETFEIYYILHSKMYFGLDSAMKVDEYDDNEGFEESFKIILKILLFISQYYKYILDNNQDFINYENNIDFINKNEFIDLKIVNKKYAFFSFFDESINVLCKIFANEVDYLIGIYISKMNYLK